MIINAIKWVYDAVKNVLEEPGHKGSVEPVAVLDIVLHSGLLGQELLLLAVDGVLAGPEIGFFRCGGLALHEKLISEKHDEVERDTEVGGDEILGIEVAVFLRVVHEDVVILGEGNKAAEDKSEIRAVLSEGCFVGKRGERDILGHAGTDKVDMGDEDRDPGKETENGDKVDKVTEDSLGIIGNVHEGEEGERGGEAKSIDWDTTSISAGKDLWCLALAGESVDGTGGNVEI